MPPPSSDDATLAAWRTIITESCAPLLSQVAALTAPLTATAIERLRRDWPAALIPPAIELVNARTRAVAKFPDGERLVADVDGVEQATAHRVAEHKAQRFARSGISTVADLCCGIGGDTMSLARVAEVTAIDHHPLRAWMAGCNAQCSSRVSDVTKDQFTADAFHLDPQRRNVRGRAWRYADYEPSPSAIDRLIATHRHGAIKLGPGVDLDELPLHETNEIELISDGGRLVQAVLWCGQLAEAAGFRRATMLPVGATLVGRPGRPPGLGRSTFEGCLLVPDPAVERAELLHELCAQLGCAAPHPPLGLLRSDRPIDSPWLTSFEVVAEMGWRPERVKAWLDAHDAGIVEVKTRGKAVDPDSVQRQLRGRGETPYTVFVLRVGTPVVAVITQRANEPPP